MFAYSQTVMGTQLSITLPMNPMWSVLTNFRTAVLRLHEENLKSEKGNWMEEFIMNHHIHSWFFTTNTHLVICPRD